MEKTIKTTKRDILTALKAMAEDGNMHIEDFLPTLTDRDVKDFCDNELELLAKKTARSREAAAKKRAEGDEITTVVRDALSTEDFEPISVIADRINDDTISKAKIVARLRNLIECGEAEKQEMTTDDKRKVMSYRKLA